MAEFRYNQSFERDAARSPALKALLRQKGQEVGREADRIGQTVARSYRTEVEDTPEGVRVSASTGGINAASWIEWGTGPPAPTPTYAPLRRGAEAAGLDLRDNRRKYGQD